MSQVRIAEPHCISEEVLTVADTAVGFATLNPPRPPDEAVVQVRDAQISMRIDGTAPTATVGTFFDALAVFKVTTGKDITNFKAIRTGTVSAKLHIKFFRYLD